MKVVFRCPPDLRPHLPQPVPAGSFRPDWFEKLPRRVRSPSLDLWIDTARTHGGFGASLDTGFLLRLPTNLVVERPGEVSWNWDVQTGSVVSLGRSPIDVVDPAFLEQTPLFTPNTFILTFVNHWMMELPEGWDVLLLHPPQHADLPFRTVPMRFHAREVRGRFVHMPAVWSDPDFVGVVARGTPYVLGVPIPDAPLEVDVGSLSASQVDAVNDRKVDALDSLHLLRPRAAVPALALDQLDPEAFVQSFDGE